MVPFEDARAVIAGYCLGDEQVTWRRPAAAVGDELKGLRQGAFAYRTYDCIPPAPSYRLEPIDVLVADGLNAQLRAGDIARVLAVADAVSDQLARIGPDVRFWELARDEVAAEPADRHGPAWAMWRAWTILTGIEGVDLARSHKILHHKRPAVFPLLDNKTVGLLGRAAPWAAVHDDLSATSATWRKLETEVARLLPTRRESSLSRLRLHDILVWTWATKRWDTAHSLGVKALARQS
jgi:hypothetical protein